MADWYPTNMDEKLAWHQNFAANIVGLATKYNITPAQLTQIAADLAFLEAWVPVRHALDAVSKQVTAFFNAIAGNDPTADPPAQPAYEIPDAAAAPPPGIEYRTREYRRQIKGTTVYSAADGQLLGLDGTGGPIPEGEVQPTIEVSAAQSGFLYSVVVTGRAEADMWQVIVQPVGNPGWSVAGSATGKSIDITYPGTDEPVQLQVRVQLRKKNANYGNPSDITLVTVNP